MAVEFVLIYRPHPVNSLWSTYPAFLVEKWLSSVHSSESPFSEFPEKKLKLYGKIKFNVLAMSQEMVSKELFWNYFFFNIDYKQNNTKMLFSNIFNSLNYETAQI